MADISKKELRKEITAILKAADLTRISTNKVRQLIEEKFDVDLIERRKEVHDLVMECLEGAASVESEDWEEEEEEGFEEKEEEEEKKPAKRNPAKKTPNKRKKRGTNIIKAWTRRALAVERRKRGWAHPQQGYAPAAPPVYTGVPPPVYVAPPQPVYAPPPTLQPTYAPPQPMYAPPHSTYAPPHPTYPTYPTYVPPHPTYAPPHPTYAPSPQQPYPQAYVPPPPGYPPY